MQQGTNTEPHAASGLVSISCIRCRHRKIKCDRRSPCSRCFRAKVECEFPSGGERSRTTSKKHVEALEGRIKSLEEYIKKLATSDEATRTSLLSGPLGTSQCQQALPEDTIAEQEPPSPSNPQSGSLILARAREGRLCKLTARRAAKFYGGTSLFRTPLSEASPQQLQHNASDVVATATYEQGIGASATSRDGQSFPYQAKGAICRHLMATFFQTVYQHNMCVYREYFLRDYDTGDGPYYSDALMFSICAIGALVSTDPTDRIASPIFARHAERIVFDSLEVPDLTILQSLILLGNLHIGQGRSSKGWLLCGMAFRLTHEMGLHLDPTNWSSNTSDSSVDREILRRVYWAVFIADKQLSLYFGRPPALYPEEADVRNTIRIPYPPEWEALLDSYISRGTSATAFEDGIRVVGCFVHTVELAKIFHALIVDVFENRSRCSDPSSVASTANHVHTSLVKWHTFLPHNLQWNQWMVGQVPPYVLHLHLLFNTCMIILHRPPHQHLNDESVIRSEGVELCYQSLAAILRLLKTYQRFYRLEILPLDFVQTLSAAAEVIMLKRYMEKMSWCDREIQKPMEQVLEAMEVIQHVYPCVLEIRDSILLSRESEMAMDGANSQAAGLPDLDLMDLLQAGANPFSLWCHDGDSTTQAEEDLGVLVTDDTMNEAGQYGIGCPRLG